MRIDDLRCLATTHTLFLPTTLARAMEKLAFVQADPIRAPARAQDLILRHRVRGYRRGDLDAAYAALAVSEDFFINYGFVSERLQALMHPRVAPGALVGKWRRVPAAQARRARDLLTFVRERGEVHPRDADAHFAHGTVTNGWGGSSTATTHLLDQMHYSGVLRIVRRDAGVRVYAAIDHAHATPDRVERLARLDAMVDVVLALHAPLPGPSLGYYVRRLRIAAPQWRTELAGTLARTRERLAHARVGGVDWYWPLGARSREPDERVRLLTPFDPIVHDRARFEHLWGWQYRFEAYTPPRKRRLGYYALPLLFRERVVGWGNVASDATGLDVELGYASGRAPAGPAFRRGLDEEIERIRTFLRPRGE